MDLNVQEIWSLDFEKENHRPFESAKSPLVLQRLIIH